MSEVFTRIRVTSIDTNSQTLIDTNMLIDTNSQTLIDTNMLIDTNVLNDTNNLPPS